MAARKRTKDAPAEDPAATRNDRLECVVVGIGASAGGLEALKKFFDATQADCGLAFVVFHLDPTRESHMTGLLARHTRLQVEEVRNNTPVEPGHVYVIPPDKYLVLHDGVLRLSDPGGDERAPREPIDHFFRSLGADRGARAVGVVLSGTGSEGALGLKELHAQGGLTLAQAPETAGHPGMPRSAIATGAVDHVLAPEAMPEQILRFVRHPYVGRGGAEPPDADRSPDLKANREDLQTTIEELETAKKALQSLNEELSTVHAQLSDKVDELEERVERRTDLIRLFQDLTVAANEADAINAALLYALRRVCDFDGWEVAHALRVEGDGILVSTGLWHAGDEGRYPRFRRASLQARFGPGQGLPGRVLQTGGAQWVRDAAGEPWFGRDEAARAEGVGGGIAFPVLVGKELTHVLEFYAAVPKEPDPGLLEVMVGVGAQLGRVVERQRMQVRLAEVAGLEQRRLGQELHDTIGQDLVGLGLVAKSLHGRLAAAAAPDAARAGQLVDGLEAVAGHVRELAGGLFLPEMGAASLVNSLRSLAGRMHERYDTDCTFEQEGDVALRDEGAALHLYHIAKEALSNALRHARASRVVVRLEGRDRRLRLEVRDNGDGIPDGAGADGELWRPGRGMGLRIMRSRAELIGATLEVRRGEGGGTVVACTLRQEGGQERMKDEG